MIEQPEDLAALVRRLNASVKGLPIEIVKADAAGTRQPDQPDLLLPVAGRLDALLEEAVKRGASDLLFVAGAPPSIRIHGSLVSVGEEEVSPALTRSLARALLDGSRFREFQAEKAADLTVERPGIGRFRCDIHHQRGSVALSIRILPLVIPGLRELNLPSSYERFAHLGRGLVLFCGPTGCGKSTTMASLIEIVSRSRAAHIVTIEDPIEYMHHHQHSIVEQIEVGHDTPSFASALRHALRQNPDVILVGEMRDLETIGIALTAAETGHLIFSTVHTPDAAQTIDRIVDIFPEHQQNQARQQLSLSLAGIAVQFLVPTADGKGRVPACEILYANDAIRNLIRTAKNHLIYSQMTMGRREGMITLEDSLAALVRSGTIARAEALLRAGRREELEKLLA